MARIFDSMHNCNVAVYESMTELRAVVENQTDHYKSGWGSGGQTMKQSIDRVINGVPERETKLAQELMRKVNADFGDRHKVMNVRNVSGHRVNMGAYVSGNPNNMMKRRRTITHVAPIKMVIEVTVSAGCDDDMIQRRGAALAALASVVSRLRPVTLYAAWGLGNGSDSSIGMVKIPSTPLGVSQAVAIMATEEMARKITFTEMHEHRGFKGGAWAICHYGNPQNERRIQQFREAIQLKDDDVFIPGGHISNADKILKDPVAWVHEQLANQR